MDYLLKKEGCDKDTENYSIMQVKESKRNAQESGESIDNPIIFKNEGKSATQDKVEVAIKSEICTNIEEKSANNKKKSSAKNVNEGKRTPRSKQKPVGNSNISVKEEKTDIQIKPVTANNLEITVKEESGINNNKYLVNIPSLCQIKEEKVIRGKKRVSSNPGIQVKAEGDILVSNRDSIDNSAPQSVNVKKASSTKKKLLDKTISDVKKELKVTQSSKSSVKSSAMRTKKEEVPSINDQKVASISTSDTAEPPKLKGAKTKSSTIRVKKEKAPSTSDQKAANASISISVEPLKQKGTKAKTSSSKKTQTIEISAPITKNLNLSELLKESDQDICEFGSSQNSEDSEKLKKLEQLENLTSSNETNLINRSLRKEYRRLHTNLTKSQNILSENKAQSIKDHVGMANELYKKVNGTFEATLDSKVLVLAADMSVKFAKELKASTKHFSLELFENCLLDKLKIEDSYDSDSNESESNEKSSMPIIDKEKWKYFNLITSQQIQPVGGLRILTGPLSLQYKPRVRRSAQNKLSIPDELTIIQEADNNESDLENTTTANVIIVANTLEKCGPINLFKFVINPQSYGQTVENIFFLSFLIRDGKARIEVDEDNHPILTRCKPPTHEDYRNGITKKQWFFEIDELMWRGMVKLFDLKKSIIPHRNYEDNDNEGIFTWK